MTLTWTPPKIILNGVFPLVCMVWLVLNSSYCFLHSNSDYFAAVLLLCTFPFEQAGYVLFKIGRLRFYSLDLIVYLPDILPYTFQLLPYSARLVEHIDQLAPHIHQVMIRKEFLFDNIDVLMSPKARPLIDKIEFIVGILPQLDDEEIEMLTDLLPDLVELSDVLALHIEVLSPYLRQILPYGRRILPHYELLLPYVDEMTKHIPWLLPFMDHEGWEEVLQYIDRLAPHIDDMAPYGPTLLPLFPLMQPYLHILVNYVDQLLPEMDGTIENIEFILKHFAFTIPFINVLGLLNYKVITKTLPIFAKILPKNELIANEALYNQSHEGIDTWLNGTFTIPEIVIKQRSIVYYRIYLNSEFLCEMRYSELFQFHQSIKRLLRCNQLTLDHKFPGKNVLGMNESGLEQRRIDLQNYLQRLSSNPHIVKLHSFQEKFRSDSTESVPH